MTTETASDSSLDPKRPRGLVVAIDGPAGAGKSTVARHLAARFGLLNLETGAMYRAFALKARRMALQFDNEEALARLSRTTMLTLAQQPDGNRVLLDGEDVTSLLRSPEITEAASRVSVHPQIRAWMVARQQELGAHGGVVMEGRDIGTVVFPEADVKIFLDASPEVRGQRRFEQTGNTPAARPSDEVAKELRARDERDRNRAVSPLRPAADAIILDSTYLTLEEVLLHAEEIVRAALASGS